MFDESDNDDNNVDDYRAMAANPHRSASPTVNPGATGQPVSQGVASFAGRSNSFPTLSVDGRFAQQVVARSSSDAPSNPPSRRPGAPAFEEHDEAVFRTASHSAGGGGTRGYTDAAQRLSRSPPTTEDDPAIVHSRDPTPRRFDPAPALGPGGAAQRFHESMDQLAQAQRRSASGGGNGGGEREQQFGSGTVSASGAAESRQRTVIGPRDLFGLAAATNANYSGPAGPEEDDALGFRRAAAPTVTTKPTSPVRSPRASRRSPPRKGVSIVDVEPYGGPQPSGSHAPRLRTAERSRMSPLAERKAVHVTAAMTGRQAQMEAELDRLSRAVAQRDQQIGNLESDNQRLRAELRESELRNTTILEKYRATHESLAVAVAKLRAQQRDIERLQGALVGESTDNDVLRHGFTSLLRSAKSELQRLQEDAAARQRADWYMK